MPNSYAQFDATFLKNYEKRRPGSVNVVGGEPLSKPEDQDASGKNRGEPAKNTPAPASSALVSDRKANKNNAVPTNVDGIRFASKWEAECYRQLDLRRQAGEFPLLLLQVPLVLPGFTPGGKQRNRASIDFMIVHDLSAVEFIDAKGKVERDWHLRRCMAEDAHGIEITLMQKS